MSEAGWLRATHQLWRVRIAGVVGVLVAAGMAVFLFAQSDGLRFASIAASVVGAAGFVALAISVKCRVCDEYVMWRAVLSSGAWWNVLYKLDACPNCGARDDTEKLV